MTTFSLTVEKERTYNFELENTTFLTRDNIHSDTTEHWNAQPTLVGKKNHLYIYTDHTIIDDVLIPAIKAGDGNAFLIDAPFILGSGVDEKEVEEHMANTALHVSDADRTLWNSKVSCTLNPDDPENLMFTTSMFAFSTERED